MSSGRDEIEFLTSEIRDFKYLYDDYLNLYEDKTARHTLDTSAPHFFRDLFYVFQEYFFIRAARFLDPASQGGNANITSETVLIRARTENWQNISEIEQSYKLLNKDIALIRKVRNKQLAHLDLKTHIIDRDLYFPSPATLDDFMNNAITFINLCRDHYNLRYYRFQIIGDRAGAAHLIQLFKSSN